MKLKTLRDLAGSDPTPCSLRDSALVLIDCQNTYRQGTMELVGIEEALQEARRLLHRARDAGAPVIHVAHDGGIGSPYDVTAEIGQIADVVAPKGDEVTVIKNYPNSFLKTDLQERLQALGAKSLIIAGFMTHMCVNSTVRGAFNLGYRSTVIGDATATRDLRSPDGQVVDAQSLHRASLAGIADLFAVVVNTTDDLPA